MAVLPARTSPPGPVAPPAWRTWAGGALLAVGGVLLVVQALAPWTSRGALSTTAPVDVVALAGSGRLTSVGPLDVATLLVVPLLGGALLGLAAATHRRVRRARAVGALLAAAATAVLLVRLTDLGTVPLADVRWGSGALLATLGAALVVVGSLVTLQEKP